MNSPYYQDSCITIYNGDSLSVLKELPSNSVNCCITSPPYYGLRDYGTGTWEGGDDNCNHYRDTKITDACSTGHSNKDLIVGDAIYKSVCPKCGAIRIDKQIGLEETPNLYVERLVEVFREVKRVLKDDGTLWLNLGDSYSGSGKGVAGNLGKRNDERNMSHTNASGNVPQGLKNKDLIGIPWRVAFALQADGWWLRQDIIWHKPNPMPESVTDRCTKAHEYVFLLSKSDKYYFDHEAIQEEATSGDLTQPRGSKGVLVQQNGGRRRQFGATEQEGTMRQDVGNMFEDNGKRNKRSVWTVNTKPYKAAHFATFPENLIKPMILAGCPSGGIVLDIFGGSGTTASVSKSLGRKSISIELNEKYIELQMNRTSQNYFNFETDSETLA
jgi:DNA modification methylase